MATLSTGAPVSVYVSYRGSSYTFGTGLRGPGASAPCGGSCMLSTPMATHRLASAPSVLLPMATLSKPPPPRAASSPNTQLRLPWKYPEAARWPTTVLLDPTEPPNPSAPTRVLWLPLDPPPTRKPMPVLALPLAVKNAWPPTIVLNVPRRRLLPQATLLRPPEPMTTLSAFAKKMRYPATDTMKLPLSASSSTLVLSPVTVPPLPINTTSLRFAAGCATTSLPMMMLSATVAGAVLDPTTMLLSPSMSYPAAAPTHVLLFPTILSPARKPTATLLLPTLPAKDPT